MKIMKSKIIILILCFGFLLFNGFYNVRGAVFTVTNNADSSTGSFRQAVLNANSAVTDDIIEFAPALNGATITLSSEIFLGGNGTLTINGLGANQLIIDGGTGSNRIFQTGGVVTIRGLTLQNGGGPAFNDIGSAIRGNFGTIVLDGVIVQNNQSTQNGAIFFQLGSNHRIINSTIANNSANVCAGIRVDRTNAIITNTTISGNTTINFNGAGGCFIDGANVSIYNSTIAGNTTGNSGAGGGISISGGSFNSVVMLSNTIIAGNSAPSNPDISLNSGGSIQSLSGNIIGNNGSVAAAFPVGNPNGNFDKVGIAINLAPLGNYGGTTLTRPLLPNSPAIDAGFVLSETPATDQRGAARSGAVDIGAFEANPSYTATLPGGKVNESYSTTIIANSGSFTYTQTGGTLPPGLDLTTAFAPNAVVAITGIPTFAGNYNFAITASDGVNSIITNYSLTIAAAPTAANVSISGRVLTGNGNGLTNAQVMLTDVNGNSRTIVTGSFGYYRFDDVRVGETYIISVASKRFLFTPSSRVLNVTDELTDVDFVAQE